MWGIGVLLLPAIIVQVLLTVYVVKALRIKVGRRLCNDNVMGTSGQLMDAPVPTLL